MGTENPKADVYQGPHGLGDPDDLKLRKLEMDVLIPKKMREIAEKEMCAPVFADFHACCKATGFSMVYKCRTENSAMWGCYEKWFYDADFKQRCTNEYLAERSEYRRTGIGKKTKNLRAEVTRKKKADAAANRAANL